MAPKLTEDKLIAALVSDPAHVPDLKSRVGWLGKSTRSKHWRLYLTPNLNSYIEFAADDVVHTISLASDVNPLGGTLVSLKQEAQLTATTTTSTERQAEWLSGSITQGHLRPTGPAGVFPFGIGTVGPQPFPTTVVIITTIVLHTVIVIVSQVTENCGGPPPGPVTHYTGCSQVPGFC